MMRAVFKRQSSEQDLRAMRNLSPRRRSTTGEDAETLVAEQLAHFHIDPASTYGEALGRIVGRLYECSADMDRLWRVAFGTIDPPHPRGKGAHLNTQKFLSFQIAQTLG